jgi:hypothetical protein
MKTVKHSVPLTKYVNINVILTMAKFGFYDAVDVYHLDPERFQHGGYIVSGYILGEHAGDAFVPVLSALMCNDAQAIAYGFINPDFAVHTPPVANVAEYAAMHGLTYAAALKICSSLSYFSIEEILTAKRTFPISSETGGFFPLPSSTFGAFHAVTC